MGRAITDVAASVRQRLLNIARSSNRPFNEVLQHFAMERFLYRLAASPHSDRFVLKGALMMMIWEVPVSRPTMDIDLLAQIDNEIDVLTSVARDVCGQQVEPDGMSFDAASVEGSRIADDAEYEGVRVRFRGTLGTALVSMQLDIGFGDAVIPAPVLSDYPTILDLPAPRVRGYTRESVVAEKFHAPEQKVALFCSLLRGRADVYPRLWVNQKKGTTGYSPACGNEWVRGVCEKPRVKCGECQHQAFLPFDDDAVLGHLQGRHVMGIYPMLEDETCWFLAADFDKGNWMQDVEAFLTTCREFAVPAAVERSRSGSGAHVRIFFAAAVPAAAARTMGCNLLTETMARRHELPLSSYDRFFPNQDTVPRGGFGNLIALPLQHQARASGNTAFVDGDWRPYDDQWGFLASLGRLTPAKVDALAREGQERGRVVGVRAAESPPEHDESPWLRMPSRKPASVTIAAPLPAMVRVVLAQQIFIEKEGLPSAFLSQVKRVAAFQNPEFYKKQAMRLSTAMTPRVIGCVEETRQHLALPRGCMGKLAELFCQHSVGLSIEDRRSLGSSIDVGFTGTLEVSQQRAADDLLAHDVGVCVAPPGSGKTVIGARLIAARGRNTLILVHRTQLLEQWRTQLSVFLGIDKKRIGAIGGGKRKITGLVDVAMIQSLVRRGQADDLVATYGHVVVDECHHVSAVSFEQVMREVHARYVTGLTATPHRRDGHHPILEFQLGPVRHMMNAKGLAGQRQIRRLLVSRETDWCVADALEQPKIQDIYRHLATDADRNCSWRCRSRGRGRLCSMPVACIGNRPTRGKCASSTTWIVGFRCWRGCSSGDCEATDRWGTPSRPQRLGDDHPIENRAGRQRFPAQSAVANEIHTP